MGLTLQKRQTNPIIFDQGHLFQLSTGTTANTSTAQKKTLRSRLVACYSASGVQAVPQRATALAMGKGGSRPGENDKKHKCRIQDEDHSAMTELNFLCLHEECTGWTGVRYGMLHTGYPFTCIPFLVCFRRWTLSCR